MKHAIKSLGAGEEQSGQTAGYIFPHWLMEEHWEERGLAILPGVLGVLGNEAQWQIYVPPPPFPRSYVPMTKCPLAPHPISLKCHYMFACSRPAEMEWRRALMLMRIGLWPFVSCPNGCFHLSLAPIHIPIPYLSRSHLSGQTHFLFLTSQHQSAVSHSLWQHIVPSTHVSWCPICTTSFFFSQSRVSLFLVSLLCVCVCVCDLPSVCLWAGPGLLSWWPPEPSQLTGHFQPAPDADWRSQSPKGHMRGKQPITMKNIYLLNICLVWSTWFVMNTVKHKEWWWFLIIYSSSRQGQYWIIIDTLVLALMLASIYLIRIWFYL